MNQLSEIPKKLMEWWNKFNNKQKTMVIAIGAGVIIAVAILVTLLTRKQYVTLATCETTSEASTITELLETNSLDYQTSTDGTVISILKNEEAQANLLLGANNIPTTSYTIDKVTEGGFSTTESDKQKRYVVFLQDSMETALESNASVLKASVQLNLPQNDGTLISQETEAFAAVTLELESELEEEVSNSLASYVATALGNDTTDNVTIIDTDGNLLFSGESNSSSGVGGANTQLAMKNKAEDLVKNEVKSVLLGTDLYDNIEVASNLDLDFSSTETTNHDYTAPDNATQGLLSHEETYQSDATGGIGGTPGTDSNGEDGSTYTISDYDSSTESVTEESRDYLPNESTVYKVIPPGLIQYASSSVSVAAKKLKVYKEEEVKAQGLLVDMSWDAYKAANEEQVKLEVDTDLYGVVAKATGIPQENISIVAYEVPVFIDADGFQVATADIIQIIIIVLILSLLVFVVLRSMKSTKAVVPEEELSVESLLQSTAMEELENIELEEKSETRKMIEKFVDENPEAVASLLRNWLSEDWG